jgi:hypothetical protein
MHIRKESLVKYIIIIYFSQANSEGVHLYLYSCIK